MIVLFCLKYDLYCYDTYILIEVHVLIFINALPYWNEKKNSNRNVLLSIKLTALKKKKKHVN